MIPCTNLRNIKVGDFVAFNSSDGKRCEGTVSELENNLGQLWVYVHNPNGFPSVPLRGVRRHCIPETRIIEHRPALIVPPVSRTRTRIRPTL